MSEKNEPKYETLTLGQALDAAANGDAVEFNHAGHPPGAWVTLSENVMFSGSQAKRWQFRRAIPKKKKLVPFTKETWPIGAWVKLCGNVYPTGSISAKKFGWQVHVIGCGNKFLATLLSNGATIVTIENGKVVGEKPCGIEVEE